MKRLFFIIACAGVAAIADAQVARWIIDPAYDKIYMAEGIDAVRTDSAESKTLWTFSGRRLLTTKDELFEFKENRALTARPGTTAITSIYKNDGNKIKLTGNYNYACKYPYFSCGRLLVHDGAYFRFVNKEGALDAGRYTDAFPYFNGYASCTTYLNLEKQKDPCLLLLDKDCNPVQFTYNGKTIDKTDVKFISSVNDEGIAVVVIKRKVYAFDGRTGELSPVFMTPDEPNAKNQAQTEGDAFLLSDGDGKSHITARCGKMGNVTFTFDGMMRPVSFEAGDSRHVYKVKEEAERVLDSPLRMTQDAGAKHFGISWEDGEEILPPQFEALMTCFDNNAFVNFGGKCGMLAIEKDGEFKMRLGDGDDIGFRHKNLDTTVRIDAPTYILAEKISLEFVGDSGIVLDGTSKENKNTDQGNVVTYKCKMNIPENLSDELQEVTYPVQLTYNRLKSPVFEYTINEWFVKRYDVEIDENMQSVAHGAFSFIINIQETKKDDRDFPIDINVKPGLAESTSSAENVQNTGQSVTGETATGETATGETATEETATEGAEPEAISLPLVIEREEKITETRYKYKVSNLREGNNNIVIEVVEQGCPPALFPYQIEYHKPVEKTKTTPEKEATVAISKKPKKSAPKKPVQTSSNESKRLRPLSR